MSDLVVDTNQEAFDFVVRHFVRQRVMSVEASGSCMYRAPDGKRCAVGALIKDESYKPEMERLSVLYLDGESPERPFLNIGDVNGILLAELQCIHDAAFAGLVHRVPLEDLCKVAAEYNLDTTVLETEYAPLIAHRMD